jgi:antitoxin component of RelBE/YafQ-DinJ toxin-antitoxin module
MAKKKSSMRFRLDEDLHKDFIEACRRDDKPASQVLRMFMRQYIEQDKSFAQKGLFEEQQNQH